MAELVDAPASGAGDRKVVEVRVLFWAPFSSRLLAWLEVAAKSGFPVRACPLCGDEKAPCASMLARLAPIAVSRVSGRQSHGGRGHLRQRGFKVLLGSTFMLSARRYMGSGILHHLSRGRLFRPALHGKADRQGAEF